MDTSIRSTHLTILVCIVAVLVVASRHAFVKNLQAGRPRVPPEEGNAQALFDAQLAKLLTILPPKGKARGVSDPVGRASDAELLVELKTIRSQLAAIQGQGESLVKGWDSGLESAVSVKAKVDLHEMNLRHVLTVLRAAQKDFTSSSVNASSSEREFDSRLGHLSEALSTLSEMVQGLLDTVNSLRQRLTAGNALPYGHRPLTCLTPNTTLSLQEIRHTFRHFPPQLDFYLTHGLADGDLPTSNLTQAQQAEVGRRFCVQYGSVEFLPRSVVGARQATVKCTLPEMLKGLKTGRWEEQAAGHDVFRFNGCSMENLTRSTILSALQGRHIVIVGDSMARQMYIRLIEVLRNDRPSLEPRFERVEHYFHKDAYYVANATGDSLTLLSNIENTYQPPIPTPVVEITYLWDPLPEKCRQALFTRLNATDIFALFTYWWKPAAPHSQIDGFVSAAGDFLARTDKESLDRPLRTAPPRVFILTIPMPALTPRWEQIPARNNYIDQKVRSLRHPRANVLDFGTFTSLKGFERQSDGTHFACILRPLAPAAIKFNESKVRASGCEDPVNVNWAGVLIGAASAPLP
eukprot:TRINITY_DN57739_c0_g1_i1.p1 TRINITY_DN57739_c0_g1~~TRINITY_DN57739_c0_g1_i1.p1  ORF type:complete len:577 (+),score=13.16 TRINITY_DN57739_c0_g1_i1:63-1793(+)